jgi:hypothetical protein
MGWGVACIHTTLSAIVRIDFGLDGGIYKVEWSNKVLGERKSKRPKHPHGVTKASHRLTSAQRSITTLRVAKDIKEPESEAMLYGTAVHTAAEEYVRDGKPVPGQYKYTGPMR